MSEMIIQRVGQRSDDPILDCRLMKPGYVIAVVPDGWEWSWEERNNPDWVIVSTPMSVEEAKDLITQEDDDILNPLRQIRKTMLDFSTFPNGILDRLLASRAAERNPILIGLNSMRVAKKVIPKRTNPSAAR